jgi:hypothetical protein
METFETLLNEYLQGEIALIDLMFDSLEYFDNDIHAVIEHLSSVSEIGMNQDELLDYYDNN